MFKFLVKKLNKTQNTLLFNRLLTEEPENP